MSEPEHRTDTGGVVWDFRGGWNPNFQEDTQPSSVTSGPELCGIEKGFAVRWFRHPPPPGGCSAWQSPVISDRTKLSGGKQQRLWGRNLLRECYCARCNCQFVRDTSCVRDIFYGRNATPLWLRMIWIDPWDSLKLSLRRFPVMICVKDGGFALIEVHPNQQLLQSNVISTWWH